jgi:hypothetical protein
MTISAFNRFLQHHHGLDSLLSVVCFCLLAAMPISYCIHDKSPWHTLFFVSGTLLKCIKHGIVTYFCARESLEAIDTTTVPSGPKTHHIEMQIHVHLLDQILMLPDMKEGLHDHSQCACCRSGEVRTHHRCDCLDRSVLFVDVGCCRGLAL